MSRLALFSALVALGTYAGTLLKSETPQASRMNAPEISAAVNHGDTDVTPVRWGRFFGGGYYGPGYYGAYPAYGYSSYYTPYWGGSYYTARPYYYGGYGYGASPYYSWWW